MNFDKDPLAIEQRNLAKIVIVYVVYDLDAWSRKPTSNFKFKNCWLEITNIVKTRDQEKYVYSKHWIIFDSAGSWSFDNDFARDVIIFCVDNSSSSRSDNRKNNLLILSEFPTYGINGSFESPAKKVSTNFTWANTKFCLSLHCNAYNSYLFINRQEIFKFKADNKNVNFPTQYCLKSISNGLSATESRKVFLNRNVYDFLVDYNFTDKSDILKVYKYLMTKNNVK